MISGRVGIDDQNAKWNNIKSYGLHNCFLSFSSEVLEAIENVILDVLKSLAKKKAPVLTLANRSDWRNIE